MRTEFAVKRLRGCGYEGYLFVMMMLPIVGSFGEISAELGAAASSRMSAASAIRFPVRIMLLNS